MSVVIFYFADTDRGSTHSSQPHDAYYLLQNIKMENSNSNGGQMKPSIKSADMKEEVIQDAVDCAKIALERYEIEKDIAAYIKKEFDKKYQPTWHCVVGRNFGSYVTHETGHFIYFYIGHIAILLFRSG
ncbi:unnamed protein product [Bathycoccus prasinos]